MTAALALTGVRRSFTDPQGGAPLLVVDDVCLEVGPTECVAVIGPSGCGKTTLLRLAAGLLAPDAGAVAILGGPPEVARRQKAIGIVFQAPGLLPWRTALQNVRLPLQINPAHGPRVDRSRELLRLVGLEGFERHLPHQLSGGMQQRVALARALVTEPQVLLMDEPFSALDELTRTVLQADFLRLRERRPVAVLFVTHSIDEAVRLGDRVVALSPRPAKVLVDLPIELPEPRSQDPDILERPEARTYVRTLRRVLFQEPAPVPGG